MTELTDAEFLGTGAPTPPSSAPAELTDAQFLTPADTLQPDLNSAVASPAIGFNRGVANVVGAPVDAASWAMRKLGAYAEGNQPGLSGFLATTPTPAATPPFMGSDWIKQHILGGIGANPDAPEHEPRSNLERVLQAGGEGAASMVAPEAALSGATAAGLKTAPQVGEFLSSAFGNASTPAAVAKSAAIGATSGATGEAAAQQFDPDLHPYWAAGARLLGNVVGGGAAAVGSDINPWATVKAFKAPLNETGQEQLAGGVLRGASSDPSKVISDLETQPHEIVPNAPLTAAQVTDDPGLYGLEKRVATQSSIENGNTTPNSALFNNMRGKQSAALADAVGNLQTTGSPEDVAAGLRTKLNSLEASASSDQAANTATAQGLASGLGGDQTSGFYGEQIRGQIQPQVDVATQAAAQATNAIGGAGTPEGYGAALRDPAQDAKIAARNARSALYQAVDPDGTLNVVATTLRNAGDAAAAKLSPLAEQPAGKEAAILNTIRSLPDVVPFNDLQALDARVSAAMAEERKIGETPVWGRLAQMKGAVQDAIDNGVANQVAYERSQTAVGAIPADETVESRIQAWQESLDAQQQRQASLANDYGDVGTSAGTQAAPVARVLGTESQGNGGSGNTTGNQGGSAPTGKGLGRRTPVTQPQSMIGFLKSIGGLRDDPELKGRDLRKSTPGLMNNKRGLSLDKAREAVAEAGYLGEPPDRAMAETDIGDFLDALDSHPRYRSRDAGQLSQWADQKAGKPYKDRLNTATAGVGEFALTNGLGPVDRELGARAAEIYLHDPSIGYDGALERASIVLHNENIDNFARQGAIKAPEERVDEQSETHAEIRGASAEIGDGGQGSRHQRGAPGGRQAVPNAGQAEPVPNFDAAAAERLAEAKQAHAQYAQTYRQGPVGDILKTNGYAGQYRIPNAAIPEKVFAKGAKGYETAMAYRAAVKDDPAALDAAHNVAAMTLRRMAERQDGTIDPAKFSAWKSAYDDALRAFPGLAPKFSTAAKASAELEKFSPYRADMAPFNVPEVFFHAGAGGKEGVDNLRRLIGDDAANSVLTQYAAAKLKATPGALRPDGTLDPAVTARFQKAHAEALSSFPALGAKFSTAARATDTIGDVAQIHKAGIDAFQAGAIGKIIKAAPEDVTNQIGSVLMQKQNTVRDFGRLAQEAKAAGPDAVAGLRKAVGDFISKQFISNTEAGTSGANLLKSDAFQTFMKEKRAALSRIFSDEELKSMDAVAEHLHRVNRSVTAVKLPGSPGTAQELSAVAASARKPEGSILHAMLAGGGLGFETFGHPGAVVGALGGVAKHFISSARAEGYSKVDQLVRDALLDPKLAAYLMKKASVAPKRLPAPTLRQNMARVGAYSVANQFPTRAFGGRAEPLNKSA
jgi:hypothetical protein